MHPKYSGQIAADRKRDYRFGFAQGSQPLGAALEPPIHLVESGFTPKEVNTNG
jgi:hypothetical protein